MNAILKKIRIWFKTFFVTIAIAYFLMGMCYVAEACGDIHGGSAELSSQGHGDFNVHAEPSLPHFKAENSKAGIGDLAESHKAHCIFKSLACFLIALQYAKMKRH